MYEETMFHIKREKAESRIKTICYYFSKELITKTTTRSTLLNVFQLNLATF